MIKYIVQKDQVKQIIIREGGEYVVDLVGEGAEAEILGGFVVDGNKKEKVVLNIFHKAKNTKADTLLKAVVLDSGEVDIRGKIIVEKKAQQTESFLQERVLMISDKAKATAIPDLEIEANEVKCSHAAAVGKIDADQLYYLMSRGIDEKKIRNPGFIDPGVGRLFVPGKADGDETV